jgi:DNA repair protein REV1
MSELEPPSQPRSSSFPISSPSFWEEAAVAAATTAPDGYPSSTSKRPRTRSASPGDDGSPSDPFGPSSKRSRRGSPSTTLSYLPNRADLLADDPHAYLANPEYAPNRFGDIGDYMRKKEIKIQTQNRDIAHANAISGLPQIFTGLSFYINGNTHPPMEDLRKMILQRGGEVRPVLRSKGMVKFIIAPMLTQMKFKQFQNYRVVREAWITESCEAGKLLDWSRWKLTVQGGWEEEGRKGLEGFFAGKPSQVSQTVKAERSEAEPVEETEVEVQAPHPQVSVQCLLHQSRRLELRRRQ